ncbi:MAG TPA: DNA polymerase III subunit delta [Candidatus Obscuribacterales bacterium]
MPIYLYWGDDDFSLLQAVERLRSAVVDPSWDSFNSDRIVSDQANSIVIGLNQAMTPPFGPGGRFVWLADTPLMQQCPPEVYQELERTLPVIPDTTTLLLTSANKPDKRLKSTKFLEEQIGRSKGELREFSRIKPWETDKLEQQVRTLATERGVNLTPKGIALLAELVGNDIRQLYNELEKLQLFSVNSRQPLSVEDISRLVQSNTQNSLKLASCIKAGQTSDALELIADLLLHNEPALKIVATLVSQFRTWLWIKLMMETGVRDKVEIAKTAEIGNPNRVFFLQKEVQTPTIGQFQQSLPLLLQLEAHLKRGGEELSTLQIHIIELCRLFQRK